MPTHPTQNPDMPPLPVTTHQRKRLMQVNVDGALYEATLQQAKKHNLYTRHIVEWGMRAYLLNTAPDEARKLGIAGAGPDAD